MIKNQFFTPVMRIIAVLYFIYKMAFSDPNLNWSKLLEFDNSSPGAMTGDIFIKVVFGFVFIAFLVYQTKQAVSEFRQKASEKSRLRLISIIWSFMFYPVAFKSLFNVNLEIYNTSITDYLFEFYTVSTIIGVTAGIIVIIRDIKILRRRRKNKKVLQEVV